MPEPTIPGFTIVERIGSGGFATVYRALHDDTGVEWAIKVLRAHEAESDDLRRFERERTTMQALSGHDNIVSVEGAGVTDGGLHYTVLEYVAGGSVRDLLRTSRALHWPDAVSIGVQMCDALDLAHRNGVLHRDIKPANILLDGDVAKLTDFGIARLVGQSAVTQAQSIIGTLAYTPPEILHNQSFDGRGDIYQLGVSLYEMLLGRPPFTSTATDNQATIMRRILENAAPSLAQFDIPQPLSDLLDEVLAKDPADRPQSASGFGERLAALEVSPSGNRATPMAPSVENPDSPATVVDARPSETVLHPDSHDEPTPSVLAADPVVKPFRLGEPEPEPVVISTEAEPVRLSDPEPVHVSGPEAAQVSEPSSVVEAVLAEASTPSPASDAPSSDRWKWLAGVGVLLLAVSGGVIGFLFADSGGDDPDPGVEVATEDQDQVDESNPEPAEAPAFAPFAPEVFAAPAGDQGIAFGSVVNSGGLSIVGAAGSGDSVGSQASQLWTIGPDDGSLVPLHRPNFPRDGEASTERQRLWDIGVIDGETFLAVGDGPQDGFGTNGEAWVGAASGQFLPISDATLSGEIAHSLRAVDDDGVDAFLVAGSRAEGGASIPALWRVTQADDSWETTEWTLLDINSDGDPDRNGDGILNDVFSNGEVAVAVGYDDAAAVGIIKIRRGDTWEDLISPIPDAALWGVTIAGDRVIAVGAIEDDAGNGTPLAIVTDIDGNGFLHELPVRGTTGLARDVVATASGSVVVVGDDRDGDLFGGGIWELLPGDTFGEDRWTTRANAALQAVDGFIELWSISEFDGQMFVFGRTEDDSGRPAGAWTLDLSS